MGHIKWYKRDPQAALNGMMELTLEERGAYNTVLDLIYSRDGILPDDERFVAGWLRVDVRVWKRIKSALMARGKLFVEDGRLRNSRADVEVLEALSRVASARDAGLASAASKAAKSGNETPQNNDIASTDVPTDRQRPFQQTTTTTTVIEEEEAKASPSPRAKRAAGARIPADFVPSTLPPSVADLVAQWPPGRVDRELDNFRDYWKSRSRDACRLDWDATWHNRIRDIHDRVLRDNRNGHRNKSSDPKDTRDGFQRALDRDMDRIGDGSPADPTGRPDAGQPGALLVIPGGRAGAG